MHFQKILNFLFALIKVFTPSKKCNVSLAWLMAFLFRVELVITSQDLFAAIADSLSSQQKVTVLCKTKQGSVGRLQQWHFCSHPKSCIHLSGSAGSLPSASPRAAQWCQAPHLLAAAGHPDTSKYSYIHVSYCTKHHLLLCPTLDGSCGKNETIAGHVMC